MKQEAIEKKEWVDIAIRNWVDELPSDLSWALLNLKKSIEYTLVRGGKRFRPLLSLMVADQFHTPRQRMIGWVTAIEMIHNYSLIHDDLPCMDNDFERRGEPTNHVVYGESTALLAGDALLTEAFGLIAHRYESEPALAIQLVRILAEASGYHGMVGGQAIDMAAHQSPLELDELMQMHRLKTGALIRAAVEGAAILSHLPPVEVKKLRDLGELIGLAFQLKDDLLDSHVQIEPGSIPEKIGLAETLKRLESVSEQAFEILDSLGLRNGQIDQMIQFNLERSH